MSTDATSHQLPSSMVAREFGEVNVRRQGGEVEVNFTILMEPDGDMAEGWQTGVALDASASMKGWFGRGLRGHGLQAALRLLGVLPLAGKVVTGDAMFTHRDLAQEVRDQGGDYILIVKDNQPELRAAIQAALHDDAAFSPLPA